MLTGRFTFRRTLTGKIILQVEEEVRSVWPMSRKRPFRRRWRDASTIDLSATELRPLMDLRQRLPPPMPATPLGPGPSGLTAEGSNIVHVERSVASTRGLGGSV
jgi:hypothetical protein